MTHLRSKLLARAGSTWMILRAGGWTSIRGRGLLVLHSDRLVEKRSPPTPPRANLRTMPRRLFIVILATVLLSHRVYSASGGVVQGVIADDVGGPLPEAHVSVQRRDGSIVKSTESGGMGFYRIELPPGDYTLTASHRDYRPESTRISVAAGKETTVSIQLRTRTSLMAASPPGAMATAGQSSR